MHTAESRAIRLRCRRLRFSRTRQAKYLSRALSPSPPAAMDPDHNRQAFIRALRRRPDIEKETVLGWRRQIGYCRIRLHTCATILVGRADALPFRRRLRSPPPEISDRRSCVRNTTINREPLFNGAL